MKSVRAVAHAPLIWTASSKNPIYELCSSEGDLVATLHRRKWPGSEMLVKAADSCWVFKRRSGLVENFTVAVSETEVAVMKFGWWRAGVLSFSSGRKFSWTHNSPLSSESRFLDENYPHLISAGQFPAALQRKMQR